MEMIQKPTLLSRASLATGPKCNPSTQGDFWASYSFIHCLLLIRTILGSRGAYLCLSQASLGIKAGYTLDRVPTHRRAHTHTHSHAITHYGQFRDANQPTTHVFGLGEETPRHRENMQTPHTLRRQESNPQPWRCEANVLTTKPPCPQLLIMFSK
ncbi:hypothetical protein QTP70_027417 [Hemibagrus guttatus]|uniref:Uncharacterized protein n=1 Tax=Hemibagrus guttatus TaxID=175788 RepID=A0AAE0R0K2_9TELE|nr:hypothetical protein QTP70_027417 [Hemibagrus guttatus]